MDKLKMRSPNLVDATIDKIAELFPNCITEDRDDNRTTVSLGFGKGLPRISTSPPISRNDSNPDRQRSCSIFLPARAQPWMRCSARIPKTAAIVSASRCNCPSQSPGQIMARCKPSPTSPRSACVALARRSKRNRAIRLGPSTPASWSSRWTPPTSRMSITLRTS